MHTDRAFFQEKNLIGILGSSDSPKDEARHHGDPGDAADLGPFGVLVDVPAAAAQTDQVDGQDQQAQAQTHGANARQEYQRLGGEGRR